MCGGTTGPTGGGGGGRGGFESDLSKKKKHLHRAVVNIIKDNVLLRV